MNIKTKKSFLNCGLFSKRSLATFVAFTLFLGQVSVGYAFIPAALQPAPVISLSSPLILNETLNPVELSSETISTNATDSKIKFDAQGNVTELVDSFGIVTGFYTEKDMAGRIRYTSDGVGDLTLYNYTFDKDGNVETTIITDGLGVTSIYNQEQQLISLLNPQGVKRSYAYLENGELASYHIYNTMSGELLETATFNHYGSGESRQTTVIVKDFKNQKITFQVLESEGQTQSPKMSKTFNENLDTQENYSAEVYVSNLDGSVLVNHYNPRTQSLMQSEKKSADGVRLELTHYHNDQPVKVLKYSNKGILRAVINLVYGEEGAIEEMAYQKDNSENGFIFKRIFYEGNVGSEKALFQIDYDQKQSPQVTLFHYSQNGNLLRSETYDGLNTQQAPLIEKTFFNDGKPSSSQHFDGKSGKQILQEVFHYDSNGILKRVDTENNSDNKSTFLKGKFNEEQIRYTLSYKHRELQFRDDYTLNPNGDLMQIDTRKGIRLDSSVYESTFYSSEKGLSQPEYAAEYDAEGNTVKQWVYSVSSIGYLLPQPIRWVQNLLFAVISATSNFIEMKKSLLETLKAEKESLSLDKDRTFYALPQLSEVEVRAGPIVETSNLFSSIVRPTSWNDASHSFSFLTQSSLFSISYTYIRCMIHSIFLFFSLQSVWEMPKMDIHFSIKNISSVILRGVI